MLKPAKTIGPFPAGIDNRRAAFDLPNGALRDAVNVDITDRGRIRRRAGSLRVRTCTAAASLWSTADGARGFYAENGTLYEHLDSGASPIATALAAGAPVAYVEIPGRGIAFTDGFTLRRIVGTAVMPFAVPTPQALPVVTVGAPGALPAGYYSVACAWLDVNGEESGVGQTVQVQVPDNGSINIAFPPSPPTGVTMVGVYITAPNSATLGRLGAFPSAQAGTTVSVATFDGREPESRFTVPLPAGEILAFHNGRTYSVNGALLMFTEAWSGQHSPLGGIISFPAPITILYATPTGMWIVADQTYFLSGEPGSEASLRARSPAKGVRGTLMVSTAGKTAMWFSDQGLVIATDDNITFPQSDHVEVLPAQSGASLYREQNGVRQAIVTTKGTGASVAQASTWFTASLSSGAIRDGS